MRSSRKQDKFMGIGNGARRTELGLIGGIFGSRENAALYVASLVVLIALLFLGTLMFLDDNARPDLIKIIGGLGIGALGYIGGLMSR